MSTEGLDPRCVLMQSVEEESITVPSVHCLACSYFERKSLFKRKPRVRTETNMAGLRNSNQSEMNWFQSKHNDKHPIGT